MAPRISDEAKEERRVKILQAALECFSQKGYYASKVDDIVQYSNMSKGSIYNYFSGKEDIFISILQHETQKAHAVMDAKLKEISSPLEQLRYWIKSDIPYDPTKKKLMRVHIEFWLYSTDSPEVQHVLKDRFDFNFEKVKDIIIAGQKQGEIKADIDPEKAAATFWELHDGLWLHKIIGYAEEKIEERILKMEKTMMALLT
ncbi:Fatty acid metabolism regulator protein [Lentibacillus sp. JNUCC-1]|uniref:TetR/AcrR family transcriptional regulator n=1 Tax=Lentibacillus sp. JNUCC-1 TaxID=2654513 RepID=UPI0012E72438|nr:TetR/AcrR family transcriptional regulator [Lentibacillus sp. JNUCC-1]MUV36717.1 Fatty acid metabolism regulator protein [Lentibacillus sp. JNUCC-1]